MVTHSCVLAPHLKEDLSIGVAGKYGRMFPDLPGLDVDETALLDLGKIGAPMDAPIQPDEAGTASDNPRVPAGWPLFGQFVAHDITADRSLLQHHASSGELINFRTPQLDLESVYAAGPGGSPYLYDLDDPDKFLLGVNEKGEPHDLPRNRQGVALVGDKRNDVHLIVSQLHVAFLTFHNAIVDHLRAQGMPADLVFDHARRLVQWHYQWIVVHEYLPLSVGAAVVEDILTNGLRSYTVETMPFIPVEFADAAYRFGHSQIRAIYQLNEAARGPIFPFCSGGCPVESARVLDWRYFFALDAAHPPQASKRIDTLLVHPLIDLPFAVVGATPIPEYTSLAVRDLQRSRALDLPSGEAIARAMGEEPLTADEAGLATYGWQSETTLWYYILKEAEVRHGGAQLGPVGGRIVAEVLLGLIGADRDSFLNADAAWVPTLPAAQPDDFTMADLFRFAARG